MAALRSILIPLMPLFPLCLEVLAFKVVMFKTPISVLVIIHTPDLQVLLLERADHPGYWQSVTGSQNPDETLLQTAVREVAEETGLLPPPRPLSAKLRGEQTALSPANAVRSAAFVGCRHESSRDAAASGREMERGSTGYALTDWNIQNRYEIYQEWRWRYAPGVTHNTEHVFGLMLPEPLAVTLAPKEHLQYVWLPWQAAAEKVFSSSNAEAIRKLGGNWS